MASHDAFTIRQMIDLTGLSEFTLRGWENRYKVFSPKRTKTGRRAYNKAQIEKALLLRELLKRGHRIGGIAALSVAQLQQLFHDGVSADTNRNSLHPSVARATDFMALQKWEELNTLFRNLKFDKPEHLVSYFLLPLLMHLARQIEQGIVSISQEHVVSAFMREKIYSEIACLKPPKGGKKSKDSVRFLLATPEGDHHDLGLLMAHLVIRAKGLVSLYLGAHTPMKETQETALRFRASHVLIVSTVSSLHGVRQDFLPAMSKLQKALGTGVEVWIAGGQVNKFSLLNKKCVVPLKNFSDLEQRLRDL